MPTRTRKTSEPDGICPRCNRAFDDHQGLTSDKFPDGVTCPGK